MVNRDKDRAELEIKKHIIEAMRVAVKVVEQYENANKAASEGK
ncbi:hypothetical protein [Planococcus maritimus]|nr:hypothetical protein [Planococcus maritimus]